MESMRICTSVSTCVSTCEWGKENHDRVGVSWDIKSNERRWCNSYWRRTLIPGLLLDSTEFKCRSWTKRAGHWTPAELHREIRPIPAKQTLQQRISFKYSMPQALHIRQRATTALGVSRQRNPLHNLIPQPLKKHKNPTDLGRPGDSISEPKLATLMNVLLLTSAVFIQA